MRVPPIDTFSPCDIPSSLVSFVLWHSRCQTRLWCEVRWRIRCNRYSWRGTLQSKPTHRKEHSQVVWFSKVRVKDGTSCWTLMTISKDEMKIPNPYSTEICWPRWSISLLFFNYLYSCPNNDRSLPPILTTAKTKPLWANHTGGTSADGPPWLAWASSAEELVSVLYDYDNW